jgi:uncharacterized protein YcbX
MKIWIPLAATTGAALSVLTTSSLRTFAELTPGSDWDTRRFRMNVIIETVAGGLAENDWVGSGRDSTNMCSSPLRDTHHNPNQWG